MTAPNSPSPWRADGEPSAPEVILHRLESMIERLVEDIVVADGIGAAVLIKP